MSRSNELAGDSSSKVEQIILQPYREGLELESPGRRWTPMPEPPQITQLLLQRLSTLRAKRSLSSPTGGSTGGGCVTVLCRVGRRSREPTPTRGRWDARASRLQDRGGGGHNDRQARTNLLVRVTCHRRTMPTQQKSLEGRP